MEQDAPINTIRPSRVRNLIRRALARGLNTTVLADFVASVDWSGADVQRPPIADTLGRLESWLHQYDEDSITQPQLIARLLSLLSEKERWRCTEAGNMKITLSHLPGQVDVIQLPRFEVEPQTGTGLAAPASICT